MARYMQTAAKANKMAKALMELVTPHLNETEQVEVALRMAQLVNLGIRCNPRPAQSTVRLNAVREAMQGLPVKVSMEEVTDEKTGYTFKALQAVGVYSTLKSMEDATTVVTEEPDSI